MHYWCMLWHEVDCGFRLLLSGRRHPSKCGVVMMRSNGLGKTAADYSETAVVAAPAGTFTHRPPPPACALVNTGAS